MSDPNIVIDEHSLSKEMSLQAGNYLFVAEQAVRADAVYNTSKYALDQLGAEIDSQVRMKAEADKKKVTEKLIEKEVDRHPRYKDQRIKVIKAKAEMEMLKARREAWYQRKDLLVQMAIKERHDLDAITGSKVVASN